VCAPLRRALLMPVLLVLVAAGCQTPESAPVAAPPGEWAPLAGNDRVAAIEGFSGPESVRYDPDQDVFFVSNFNGDANERDGNGFISRVRGDGVVESLRFATGTASAPMHSPRGMALSGDTLWAVDLEAVHGFDRRSGAHLASVSLASFSPGFPNDITLGADGALHVTDTGMSRVYRIIGGVADIAVGGPGLSSPNGITWDSTTSRFILVPWEGDSVMAWAADTGDLTVVGPSPGGRRDGVEIVDGKLIVSSQVDSTLQLVTADSARVFARLPGRPADIGIDTRRRRVMVPYVALNLVEIWQLPPRATAR